MLRLGGWIIPASKLVQAKLDTVVNLGEDSAIKFLVNKFPFDVSYNFKVESGHFDYISYCLQQTDLPNDARSLLKKYLKSSDLQPLKNIGLKKIEYIVNIAFHNVGRRNARLTKLIKSEGVFGKITHGSLCSWSQGRLCSKKHQTIQYQIEPKLDQIPNNGILLSPRNNDNKEFISEYKLTLKCKSFSKYPPTMIKAWCVDLPSWFSKSHNYKILLKFQSEQGRWLGKERQEKTISKKIWITIPKNSFNFKQAEVEKLLEESFALQNFYVKLRERTVKTLLAE